MQCFVNGQLAVRSMASWPYGQWATWPYAKRDIVFRAMRSAHGQKT
ncbi:hypothetical protein BZL29_6890 [Mycobacterium kansasii]|uniref:Uncharacterized protein n=1 Tax=Mycobacterium kansasii TaxID=1768 RepID=A0A1V3WMH0_MYCKA|nr:hypothetical protein BZL29_6890 [Mycobacterium kansasii]